MPKSSYDRHRRFSDRNDRSSHSRHRLREESPLRSRRNRDGESASNKRYHPYERRKTENEIHRQESKANPGDWRCFSFGRLSKLGTMDSDKCVAEIAAEKTQFDQLLDGNFRPDLMVVTVQVLANVCRGNSNEMVASVLSRACSATFLNSLRTYLADLPYERPADKWKNQLYRKNKSDFWCNLVKIFKKMDQLLPNEARGELNTTLRKVISIIESTEKKQRYEISRSVKDTLRKIYDELEARNKRRKTPPKEVQVKAPPQDFRSLSVIPTMDDLNDNQPSIRPSKLKGAYDSVEQYLDIQFRLLREDFVSPLRDGMKEYLHGPNKYRNNQLRVYRNVTLLSLEEAGNNLGLMVSFGSIPSVDWKDSKRLLFGSLLCLSRDNFNSIMFATVADRDEDLLRKGRVLIKPCNDIVMTQDHYHSDWVMLESKIYFAPYLEVLNALRQMNNENFPMKRYIVDADTSVSLPSYLRKRKEDSGYKDDYHGYNEDDYDDESDEDDEDDYDEESDEDGSDYYYDHNDPDDEGDEDEEEDYDEGDEDEEEDYDEADEDEEEDYDDGGNYYRRYGNSHFYFNFGRNGYQDGMEDDGEYSEEDYDDGGDYYRRYGNSHFHFNFRRDGYQDGTEDEGECSEDEDADEDDERDGYTDEEQVDRYKNAVLSYKGFSLPMGENEAWPTPEQLEFDESQYKAFKSALSQEFAIIQGPPGTGKTFIALEIIRTLLENKAYWRDNGPIVVVCLTNHALDQFLEGILKHTRSIVRVGSRSKSEVLSNYTLAQRRKTTSSKRRESGADRIARHKKIAALDILRLMDKTRLALRYLTTKDAIVPLSLLNAYCEDKKLRELNGNDALLGFLVENIKDSAKTGSMSGENNHNAAVGIEEGEVDAEILTIKSESGSSSDEKLFNPLEVIDMQINDIEKKLEESPIPQKKAKLESSTPAMEQFEQKIVDLKKQRSVVQTNLSQHPLLTPKQDVGSLNPNWQNYWEWVKLSHAKAVIELTKLQRDHSRATQELNEAWQMVDLEVLKEYDIVGITTTAAARLHASLRALDAPIVLVEEAAEILESHVVCSLTKRCQHVILIGDHKQLRPKAAVHELGTKYNLNISLFERMVNIREGVCTQLAHQHRMRPEIAKLISPSIYETLHNHKSVIEYPPVMGMAKNVFFLNHENREEAQDNQDTWANPFEAKFLVALTKHLILQGYQSTEITVLCTYTGQLFTLMKERKHCPILKDVRITTIDNYQGEENRIILLSLVRNNREGNIGFLKEENRVCVALSRAREGLFILGNRENLTKKNDIWPKIRDVLERSNAIGNTLELRCKFHPDIPINVQQPSDFEHNSDGVCSQKCNANLPCGHLCDSICHSDDREHLKYNCQKACPRHCPKDHPCRLLCSQKCRACRVTVERQLKCGHTVKVPCGSDPETYRCPIKADAISPHCNHAVKKKCHESLDECRCLQICGFRLPCGHPCNLKCHVRQDPDHLKSICRQPCLKSNVDCPMNHPCKLKCHEKCKPCTVVLPEKRSCGHDRDAKCSDNVEDLLCYKLIPYERSCGHKATVRCYRKDAQCEDLTTKVSTCGHKVLVKCYETPTPAHCHGKCERQLPCGHPCTARCKDPCVTECKASLTHTRPGLCGHIISVPCHLKDTDAASPAILKYCKEPCAEELACGHKCKGSCGSCQQGRIHKPCGEKCGNVLICGHRCDVSCQQECPPCQKPCEVKCAHSRCDKECWERCSPCREPCDAGCRHARCMKWCYELCDMEPCEEPCSTVLNCGHECIGYCGEPCPKLCRICDQKELMEDFSLGHEDEPNARFVLLKDCGHCIESKGLLEWVSDCNKSIQAITCPRCKTAIGKCMRIGNQIRRNFEDVQLVKSKISEDLKKLRNREAQLVVRIKDIENSPVAQVFKGMKQVVERLGSTVNARAIEADLIVLDVLGVIANKFEKIPSHTVESYMHVEAQITFLLESLPTRGQISDQELKDIKQELERFRYMTKLVEIEAGLSSNGNPDDREPYNAIMKTLLRIEKFAGTIEEQIVEDFEKIRASHNEEILFKNERKVMFKAMSYKSNNVAVPSTIPDVSNAELLSTPILVLIE